MSTTNMVPADVGFVYSGAVAAGQTSPWVFVPQGMRYEPVTVTGSPGGGASFRIEYTISTRVAIEADSALAVPWDASDVSAAKGAIIDGRITAVRLVNLGGGSVDWEARV